MKSMNNDDAFGQPVGVMLEAPSELWAKHNIQLPAQFRHWRILRGLLVLAMAIAFWLRLYGEVMILWSIRQVGIAIR